MNGMTVPTSSDLREFVQYVITAVDANPDLREPLLRALLTEEFLQMPVRLARVEGDIKTLKDDMGSVKGMVLEQDFAHRASSWLNREFGFLRNRVVHGKAGVFQRYGEEFLDAVADARDDGLITPEQVQRLLDTDVIVQCRRSGDAEPTWVAVEIAARIDADDINRALRSAEALQTLFNAPSLPVVAGERIDAPDVERARQSAVTVIILAE